jgi:predicted DCC family thiol-disulfide oxidoreductase YuxK
MESQSGKTRVYYDGLCNLCSGFADGVGRSSKKDQFEFVDANTAELPEGVSREAALQHMYLVEPDGSMYRGSDAYTRTLLKYPRWRWLGHVLMWPGVRQLARGFYWIIACNRRWLFGRKDVS